MDGLINFKKNIYIYIMSKTFDDFLQDFSRENSYEPTYEYRYVNNMVEFLKNNVDNYLIDDIFRKKLDETILDYSKKNLSNPRVNSYFYDDVIINKITKITKLNSTDGTNAYLRLAPQLLIQLIDTPKIDITNEPRPGGANNFKSLYDDLLGKIVITQEIETKMYRRGLKKITEIEESKRTLEISKASVEYDPLSLKFVPIQHKTVEICQIAVTKNGLALEFMPEGIKTVDLCQIAITQNGLALAFVPEGIKTLGLCQMAVTQNGLALAFVPDELITLELCQLAFSKIFYYDSKMLSYVPERIKKNETFLLNLIDRNLIKFQDIDEESKTENIFIALVKKNGLNLQFIPEDSRTMEICLEALKQNSNSISFIPEKIKTHAKIIPIILSKNGMLLETIAEENKTIEIVSIAVRQNGLALQFVPEDLKTQEIVSEAVRQNGLALQFVPESLKTEEIVVQSLAGYNKEPLKFIPESLKTIEFFSNQKIFGHLSGDSSNFDYIQNLKKEMYLLHINKILENNTIGKNKIFSYDDNQFKDTVVEKIGKYLEKNITISEYIEFIFRNYDKTHETMLLDSFIDHGSAKIKKISNTINYYHSFIDRENLTNNDFFEASKIDRFIWMSNNIDQSIMHLFNGTRQSRFETIQAYLARFNIEEGVRIINSTQINNLDIFENIIPPECLKNIIPLILIQLYVDQKNNPTLIESGYKRPSVANTYFKEKSHFMREGNRFILIILKELNKFLSEENKIYGYQNDFDQKEIALCDKTKIIRDSFKLSKYYNINLIDETDKTEYLTFPCKYSEYKELSGKSSGKLVFYTDIDSEDNSAQIKAYLTRKGLSTDNRVRMIPNPSKHFMICHEDFDIPGKPIETLENKPIEEYYEKKYLKYKTKYLSIKNKIDRKLNKNI